ncbi:Quinate/shikimate 5-dehydrogenase [Penicillium camemberti]|uniref:Quinate/shikimate 5-dehydrogenase n=1 Tax=Penicillium camemberti (strain FM 013) TaxID=1429867 RepID=A0A0G4PIG7_PENC3|nr:Quinate/shikimate 5-dehydrogenase [Penicillium camemberti]
MTQSQSHQMTLHLVGLGVTHSIAYSMHNYIAKSLGLPWTFYSTECPTIEDLLKLARAPSTAGLVVTMPYKNLIMKHVDELDELSTMIGACNNVYYKSGTTRVMCGTNTDWRGIKGCLLEKGNENERPSVTSPATALIVGAGGASRAAVYALSMHLHCPTIYVLNRDDQEVANLIHDTQKLARVPTIIHVKTLEQAKKLASPYYIVGTVPDFEPQTETELTVANTLESFLSRPEKGVLLDMCFKPRRTRMIKLGEKLGWPCVEGTHIIGYQIEEQWRLWAGEESILKLDREGAWDVLLQAAEESKGINF